MLRCPYLVGRVFHGDRGFCVGLPAAALASPQVAEDMVGEKVKPPVAESMDGVANPPVAEGVAKPPVAEGVANPPVVEGVANPPVAEGVTKPPVVEGVAYPPVVVAGCPGNLKPFAEGQLKSDAALDCAVAAFNVLTSAASLSFSSISAFIADVLSILYSLRPLTSALRFWTSSYILVNVVSCSGVNIWC
jgi:hypothetical protein